MNDIDKIFPARYSRLLRLAESRPLQFRQQAAAAYAACPRSLRRMARRFNRSVPMALEFFLAWRDDCLPRLRKIDRAPQQKTVIKLMNDNFLLDDKYSATLLQNLAQQSQAIERSRFAAQHYSEGEKALYRLALDFVNQPIDQCAQQVDSFINYLLYRVVADEMDMTIRDPQARCILRVFQSRIERHQVRRLVRTAQRRLKEIDDSAAEIEQIQNGLVARLFGLKIDYVTVLAARQEYEKALARLSKKSANSPAKRLALYEKKTEKLRTDYLGTVPGLSNLSDTQKAVKEIDGVLLAVFDLSNAQRNEIMNSLKRYRELVREREMLLAMISD